jgi:tryptophanyl-tRNA synthetase
MEELAARYVRGAVGDAAIKREVADAIDALVRPMRERRARFTDDVIVDILRDHSRRANAIANETLARVKGAMKLEFATRL